MLDFAPPDGSGAALGSVDGSVVVVRGVETVVEPGRVVVVGVRSVVVMLEDGASSEAAVHADTTRDMIAAKIRVRRALPPCSRRCFPRTPPTYRASPTTQAVRDSRGATSVSALPSACR